VDDLLLRPQRSREMAGVASGVSECLDAFDPRRMLTMYSVHAVCTTRQSMLLVCATSAILGLDTLRDYSQIPISLNLC